MHDVSIQNHSILSDLIFYFNFAPQYKLIKFNKWQLTEYLP